MSKFAVFTSLPTLLLVGGIASPVFAHDAKHFSFPDVAYYSSGDANHAADAFITRELPVGTPLTSAEEKLHAAGMGCTDGADRASAICHFYTVVGGDGGTLGEMWWTIHLQADLDGHLIGASFDQSRIGMGP